ncbi:MULTISPECIES: hypothetical protein [Nocardioides]|uniref:Uncharacterized protein n=1 Tax=Nocardioides vastitatis TaxID=2568655 RepID=A0ABW0ZCW6_9ACTN|nr:hypothetical protein [Nocardioides sp.]
MAVVVYCVMAVMLLAMVVTGLRKPAEPEQDAAEEKELVSR